MNAHRALPVARIELLIAALLLLTAAVLAALVPVVRMILPVRSMPTPIQRDPVQVVSSFHEALNSTDPDALLGLFAEDATISDRGAVFNGRYEIRRWALDLQRAGGLHLRMMDLQATGGKIHWRDMAANGPEMRSGAYILDSQAVVEGGKIKSLAISSLPKPDRK